MISEGKVERENYEQGESDLFYKSAMCLTLMYI